MRLLTALKLLSTLPDPFFPFEDEVSELVAKLLREKFQDRQAKQNVDFDVFLIFRLCNRRLQQVAKQLPEPCAINGLRVAQLYARDKSTGGVLTNQFKEIVARGLNKSRAEVHVVMNVIDANRKRGHRKAQAIARQLNARSGVGSRE